MGRWRSKTPIVDLVEARRKMSRKWGLKGNFGLTNLEGDRLLMKFKLRGEVVRIL